MFSPWVWPPCLPSPWRRQLLVRLPRVQVAARVLVLLRALPALQVLRALQQQVQQQQRVPLVLQALLQRQVSAWASPPPRPWSVPLSPLAQPLLLAQPAAMMTTPPPPPRPLPSKLSSGIQPNRAEPLSI
uniref:Uncharacterized protein n=1 Tax=Magnetococcus massalia (strain MO-1) TaxID=451514 RepID=A0A1S7LIZ2_MAGMO|nr:protein of unknown function [Candidatus Magnetococcus massalia]